MILPIRAAFHESPLKLSRQKGSCWAVHFFFRKDSYPVRSLKRPGTDALRNVHVHMASSTTLRKELKSKSADMTSQFMTHENCTFSTQFCEICIKQVNKNEARIRNAAGWQTPTSAHLHSRCHGQHGHTRKHVWTLFKEHWRDEDCNRCRLDLKIEKLDEQLLKLREQISRTRPGPAQEATKRRALQVVSTPCCRLSDSLLPSCSSRSASMRAKGSSCITNSSIWIKWPLRRSLSKRPSPPSKH